MNVADEQSQTLLEINRLAAQIHDRRRTPLPDREAQRTALLHLEHDLAACWYRLRQMRAGPVREIPLDTRRRKW